MLLIGGVFKVFSTIFNNILVLSWRPVLLEEEAIVPTVKSPEKYEKQS
jgi:hypothetical protein